MLALILAAAMGQVIVPPPPWPWTELTPSNISPPDWVKVPSAVAMGRSYPPLAAKFGIEGAAVLDCRVAASGELVNCAVIEESPLGAGFGKAALSVASLFKMRPLTKEGQPVAGGYIRIPIKFRTPNPFPLPPDTREVVLSPDLDLLTTALDVAQAYPAQARQSRVTGEVLVRCVAAEGGALTDCVALQEKPSGLGFGEAAVTLASSFHLKPAADDHPRIGAIVFFPIRLRPNRGFRLR